MCRYANRESSTSAGLRSCNFFPGLDSIGVPQRSTVFKTPLKFLSLIGLLLCATFAGAQAQTETAGVLSRSDAVVTGFSGIKPSDAPLPVGANPLDEFFIDLDGSSAQILSLAAPGAPPSGQLISTPSVLKITARQVGQVFATALDDGLGAGVPNIYLGATSAYGLHIVAPDSDGDGWPERLKTGAAAAEWMPGQLGSGLGGTPGSIYRLDGRTGEVTLFATVPGNSGPGLGDVVFDRNTRQFFASDLDDGRIYRISATGAVIDSFDHGVQGRPIAGLDAVEDDGEQADITDADFDIEKPETWGFTPAQRRVHGLAVREGRLFYAVNGQVWSVAISGDGFSAPRWELDADGLSGDGPNTDMLFNAQGQLYLAQRGEQRGSYDFSVFAEPEGSDVVRYRLEDPDDPTTESRWVEEPESYAIGLPEEHRQAEGGIALGYPYDENGFVRHGVCGGMLWSTGHRLRQSALAEEGAGEGESDVHGLQGNVVSLVRPQNVPPQQSYFADYDDFFGDAAKSGHMGDVEIWQPCEGAPDFTSAPPFGPLPPGILPPGDLPPDDLPPEFPPEYEYETNLRLTKRAGPKVCSTWFGGWLCRYRIRVTNTGPDDYFGPIMIEDALPTDPAGAVMGFSPEPPWACWNTGPSTHNCFRPGVFLAPGSSVGLTAYAWVPGDYGKCNLRNEARILWAPGGTQWNNDPTDDFDSANALIPADACDDPPEETDLKIYKRALGDCFALGGGLRCGYRVTVENQGPGAYDGNIVVADTVPAGTNAIFSGPPGLWVCGGASPNYTCTAAGVSLPNPGDSISFTVRVDLSHEQARELNCRVRNRVEITQAAGGSPLNTDPTNDTASALANVPDELCTAEPEKTDLKIYKRALACFRSEDGPRCGYRVTVRNLGPGTYQGDIKVEDTIPAGMSAVFSGPPGVWNCAGASPTYTCTAADAMLGIGEAITFTVRVDFTPEQARQSDCRIRNRVKITEAAGGTPQNTNPANDTANAVADVPEEICKLGLRSNLRIDKQASPTFCEKAADGWWCRYAIRVANMGPGTYEGPLEVTEALPGEPMNATWNIPWNCAGMGGGGGAVCNHPYTVMAPMTSRILFLKVKFSDDLVREKNCALPNVATITDAPGGTPKNTNPADDVAGDSAKVPVEFCEKEPTNLLLIKQGAQPECNTIGGGLYRCPFNVIVQNIGAGKYDGPITIRDDILGAEGSSITMEVPVPWNCVGSAPSITCKHPAVQLDPGQQVLMPVNVVIDPATYDECSLSNEAVILQAAGGSLQNQNAADDKDSASLPFPPLLANGKIYCHRPVPTQDCPPGFNWTGQSCERIGVSTPPPPAPPSRDCPAGFVGRYPDCKRIVTPQPDPKCPRGYVGTPPNCRQIVRPDPAPECPRGTVGQYPNCRRIIVDPPRQCTGGRILRAGECVCRRGRVWDGRRCVRRQCPQGTRGVYPNCRKVVVDPPRKCPRGTVGRWPNCRKVPPARCPSGTVGRPPNCRKIQLEVPRNLKLRQPDRGSGNRTVR